MIRLRGVGRTFRLGSADVHALADVDLEAGQGEFLVVRGPSGSGKSTLLLAVGGMLRPTAGTVEVSGQDLYRLGTRRRAAFRAEQVGFVFQMFHLVPYLSVLDNVELAQGALAAERRTPPERAAELLEKLGLGHRLRHRPAELSAGERQRVAVARALVNRPRLVLADEPTGNLDPDNAREVIRHLADFQRDGGTVLMVTHGTDLGDCATRTLRLVEGRVAS